MAASEGSACFALSYDPKVSRLMAEVGFPGLELADLSSANQSLSRIWQDYYQQRQPWKGQKALQQSAQRHQKLLTEIFSS
jgi:polysaccharide pyruvyl transferase WcaK-like protein